VCKTAKQLAAADNNNVYKLWDRDTTMGCQCDKGYYGPDCSLKTCKVGVDPLYLDDSSTVKFSIFDFATLTTAPTAAFDDGTAARGPGYWAIRFFDYTGEDWITKPIKAGASCADVISALEALPNDVIPAGMTYCTLTQNNNLPDNTGWNSGYDAQHGNGTAHPYHITYRMSIWDAYGFQDATGIAGGDGVYTPLTWFPGSFSFGSASLGDGMTTTHVTLSGFIYRIKFYGNPGTCTL